jgi:cold shock CspA family protein
METGTVLFYRESAGGKGFYGFIEPDYIRDSGGDRASNVWFGTAAAFGTVFRTGDRVEFTLKNNRADRGPNAETVRLIT